ncbi:unnamed protein product [Ixodes hexagonus]
MEEQAGPWSGYEGPPGGRPDPGVLAQEDMDMFFHSIDGSPGSSYYANPAARAVHGYRPSHRECRFYAVPLFLPRSRGRNGEVGRDVGAGTLGSSGRRSLPDEVGRDGGGVKRSPEQPHSFAVA